MLEPHHRHSYSALSHIAQGYALVIFGMTASLFLYVGMIRDWPLWPWLFTHALSVLLLVGGGWWWWRMPPLTANWLRTTEHFLLAGLFQTYMIPFVIWWRKAPQLPFYTANIIVTFAGLAWLLMMLGGVIAETGRILGDRLLHVEGRLCAWFGPLILIIPLIYAIISSVTFFIRAGLPLTWESVRVGLLWPGWTSTAMLFAPVLLLSVAIETRLRCLRAARWLRENPAAG